MFNCPPRFLAWDRVMVPVQQDSRQTTTKRKDTSLLGYTSKTILLEGPGMLVWPDEEETSHGCIRRVREGRAALEEPAVMLVSAVWNLSPFP